MQSLQHGVHATKYLHSDYQRPSCSKNLNAQSRTKKNRKLPADQVHTTTAYHASAAACVYTISVRLIAPKPNREQYIKAADVMYAKMQNRIKSSVKHVMQAVKIRAVQIDRTGFRQLGPRFRGRGAES